MSKQLTHLISLKEQSQEDLLEILRIAKVLKEYKGDLKRLKEIGQNYFSGKHLLMIFEKNSTRTKLSFEMAATALQARSSMQDMRMGHGAITNKHDELQVMTSYADAIMYRALDAKDVEFVAGLNKVPIIDGCSNKYHPSQALADIFTMAEDAGGVYEIGQVAWIGIRNNVYNSLALACHKIGIILRTAPTPRHEPSIDEELDSILAEGLWVQDRSLDLALCGASYVHTDTYVDMEYFDASGKVKECFEDEYSRRKDMLAPFRLTPELLEENLCHRGKIMHCMPCHEGEEITREAIHHPRSLIFRQAENRLYVEQAMLWWLFKTNKIN